MEKVHHADQWMDSGLKQVMKYLLVVVVAAAVVVVVVELSNAIEQYTVATALVELVVIVVKPVVALDNPFALNEQPLLTDWPLQPPPLVEVN